MPEAGEPLTYAAAGVDIEQANESLRRMMPHFRNTHSVYMLDKDGQPFAAPVVLGRMAKNMAIDELAIAATVDSAGTIP